VYKLKSQMSEKKRKRADTEVVDYNMLHAAQEDEDLESAKRLQGDFYSEAVTAKKTRVHSDAGVVSRAYQESANLEARRLQSGLQVPEIRLQQFFKHETE
jgi:hypothetical protein